MGCDVPAADQRSPARARGADQRLSSARFFTSQSASSTCRCTRRGNASGLILQPPLPSRRRPTPDGTIRTSSRSPGLDRARPAAAHLASDRRLGADPRILTIDNRSPQSPHPDRPGAVSWAGRAPAEELSAWLQRRHMLPIRCRKAHMLLRPRQILPCAVRHGVRLFRLSPGERRSRPAGDGRTCNAKC